VKLFQCTECGQQVFFENTVCRRCDSRLGYVPAESAMVAFHVDGAGAWVRRGAPGPAQRPCRNHVEHGVCNWMVAHDDLSPRCISCRTTQVVPALGTPANRLYWHKLEQAKRHLFVTLMTLGLPVPSQAADPQHGIAFRFLQDVDPSARVLTGHGAGVITLNIAEADDALREQARVAMHEPYRSLVGHFRHESGHYYWDRLVKGTRWIDECRSLFGDERRDYAQALERHYAQPRGDWRRSFISAYASSHPWEDWAECWAHYLHVVCGLETAAAWGLQLAHTPPIAGLLAVAPVDLAQPSVRGALVDLWLPVSRFNNAMNRSLGLNDSYPFTVPSPVIDKVDFIHRVVRAAVRGEVPMNFSPPPAAAQQPEASGRQAVVPPGPRRRRSSP
jgi:hypothetical protein